MEWKKDNYLITDDHSRLDVDAMTALLKTTYWAADRTRAQITASLENSLAMGLFTLDTQIGMARAVSDYSTFTWICDVIVHPDHRGQGLGKWMVQCLVSHPRIADTRMILITKDAQTLYHRYGFNPTPFECMVKREDAP